MDTDEAARLRMQSDSLGLEDACPHQYHRARQAAALMDGTAAGRALKLLSNKADSWTMRHNHVCTCSRAHSGVCGKSEEQLHHIPVMLRP